MALGVYLDENVRLSNYSVGYARVDFTKLIQHQVAGYDRPSVNSAPKHHVQLFGCKSGCVPLRSNVVKKQHRPVEHVPLPVVGLSGPKVRNELRPVGFALDKSA